MNPDIWGPHFWNVLNSIALTYPENPDVQEQQHVINFITNLQHILPCEKCREHFKENLKKFPLTEAATSGENLTKWVIDVHNSVNQSNGKRTLSYKEGLRQMKKHLFGNQLDIKYYLMFGMVGIIVLMWYFRKTKYIKNILK